MHQILLQILSGLASGSIYAAVALSLVMIYQSTHHVNFAQGEMATLSTYVALSIIRAGYPYWAAFAGSVALSFLLGMAVQRILLRPLRHAPLLTVVGAFIALMLITTSVIGWLFDYNVRSFPSPFETGSPSVGGMVSNHQLGAAAVTLVVLFLIFALFRWTNIGLALRAVAFNPLSCRLVGIRVGWLLAIGWGLAAAVGAIAGMLVAPIVYLEPNMMAGIMLYAFAGALLGGIDRPFGAVLGGFSIGVIENFASIIVGTELKLTVALVVIISVLLLCPSGVFGRNIVSRV